jgi:peroxiredoxin
MTEMTTPACCEETVRIPLIGEKAPSFEAVTTQGKISFPDDYKGKWVILFSHPADFTPVCTTEFMTFASMQEEFRELNCELIGGIGTHEELMEKCPVYREIVFSQLSEEEVA